MKRISLPFLLLLACLNVLPLMAQVKMNASAKAFLNELKTIDLNENSKQFQKFKQEYELLNIEGTLCVGVLALIDENGPASQSLQSLGILNDSRVGNIWTFRVPVKRFIDFVHLQGIKAIEIGSESSPYLKEAVPSARVDSVHAGLGNLIQAYKGTGVVIGVIDWGFDYTHPNFYDTTGTSMRLVRAWDQNKISGPAPTGFSFGTAYESPQALLDAQEDTLYVFGPGSHGTHVAGIAGGTGSGTEHGGAAPDADLIFISLRRDAPSLIDGFNYIANYAESVGKPFVVNMSFGSHLGPHDGTSLENVGIDNMHGPGKIFVGSAGNNGSSSANFHLNYDFRDAAGDTLKTVVGEMPMADRFGQTLSMWGSEYSSFSVAIRLVNTQNQTLFETPFYASINEPFINDTLIYGSNTDSLIVRILSVSESALNNKCNIRLELKKTGTAKIVLLATSTNTNLHIWNNVRMNNRYTNWGTSLFNTYPGAIGGNIEYGVGEPAGTGKNTITVGSYRAERVFPSGNTSFGQLSSFSSRGPTTDNRVKPDISSTGEGVISSINSFDTSPSSPVESVEFNGRTYLFEPYSGTSMSGPMVAGIVALMLQANPEMSAVQAKEILKTTARLDQHTGQIGEEGNLRWGWGKAHALAAVKAAELLTSNKEIKLVDNLMMISPNPASSQLNIQLNNKEARIRHIELFQQDGKQIISIPGSKLNQMSLDVSSIPSGTYLIRVSSDSATEFSKVIIVH